MGAETHDEEQRRKRETRDGFSCVARKGRLLPIAADLTANALPAPSLPSRERSSDGWLPMPQTAKVAGWKLSFYR